MYKTALVTLLLSFLALIAFYTNFNSGKNHMYRKIDKKPERGFQSSFKFFTHEYPTEHWAIDYTKAGTSIATVRIKGKYNYSIILNPTDSRGYRTIIRYLNDSESDIPSAFNRSYTISEQRGLNDVTTLMIQVYKNIGLIPQFSQLGNNSHSIDETTGDINIGNEEEPSLLHLHLWGRGNPEQEYIPGVPLRGPKPGLMFDLIAKSQTVHINQYSVKWNPKELELCLSAFKNALADYIKTKEFRDEFGDSLEIEIDHRDEPTGEYTNGI